MSNSSSKKLPVVDRPKFSDTLPSGRPFQYSMYTVKEEKMLMIAVQSKDYDDLVNGIKQIIENCTDQNPEELTPVDVEYIFLRIRAVSSSNVSELSFEPTDCNREDCPSEVKGSLNLDEVQVKNPDDSILDGTGITRKSNGDYVIPITDEMGLVLRHRNALSIEESDIAHDCLVAVYTEDDVISREEISKEEFSDFFYSFPGDVLPKIRAFFNHQQKLTCNVKGSCQTCKRRFDVDLEGFENFIN